MISPVLRPRLWSALLGAIVAAVIASPAYAEPPLPDTVPDAGSRPLATGSLQLPGTGAPVAGAPAPGVAPVDGRPTTSPAAPVANPADAPLLTLINAVDAQVGSLGDQLITLRQQRAETATQLADAERNRTAAQEALAKAQEQADEAAASALKEAAALPPGAFARNLQDLTAFQRLSRGERTEPTRTGTSGELTRARTAAQVAEQAYAAAQTRDRNVAEQFAAAQRALRAQETRLVTLRRDNATQLTRIEQQQDVVEQRIGVGYLNGPTGVGRNVGSLTAHPQALAAVRYALAQVGDPYVWAEEGPDAFDCSGLVWAAYRSAGYYGLPRVARDQYYATRGRTVDPSALLPGDLLFFASGSSWTTVHHMAMYIGGGKMVEAPRTGELVKISTVRWSRLYAATRVVGAVTGPAAPLPVVPSTPGGSAPTTIPTPVPTGSSAPAPTPSRSASPKPTPTRTTSPGGTTSPTPTGGSTPTPTPTPTGSSSPSPSGTPTTPPSSSAPAPSTSAPATTAPSPTQTTTAPSPTQTTTAPSPTQTTTAPSPAQTTTAPSPVQTSSVAPADSTSVAPADSTSSDPSTSTSTGG
ncbi:Cell wall-associated hydrolase, NlpC family [Micromonospora siamensis]|uniref:Cell wall-associated hydrolase, NlpC family n=1 Tax=Micromonospora siamensis TaxID=299152 RepID=A0A1C5H257_9ACTN|nr:Cell wall-associated hydrolase, NlpC family [Micromonospora siamensis]